MEVCRRFQSAKLANRSRIQRFCMEVLRSCTSTITIPFQIQLLDGNQTIHARNNSGTFVTLTQTNDSKVDLKTLRECTRQARLVGLGQFARSETNRELLPPAVSLISWLGILRDIPKSSENCRQTT